MNFVLTFIGATALAVVVTAFPATIAVAAFVAVAVWVASGLQVRMNDTLFARKPVALFYIDGIGHLITLAIIGVIVSLFQT